MTTPILEARDLSKRFPARRSFYSSPLCDGGGSRLPLRDARRNAGDCRGVRVRQIHARPSAAAFAGRQRRTRVLSGEEITHASGARLNQLRRELQIIFQDPFASLNPRMTVEQIVGEPLWLHQEMKKPIVTIALRNCLKPWVCLPPGGAFSARVFRWATPAHWYCACAGLRAKTAAGRRARLGAGCFRAGAGDQSAGKPEASAGANDGDCCPRRRSSAI